MIKVRVTLSTFKNLMHISNSMALEIEIDYFFI